MEYIIEFFVISYKNL